MGGDEPIAVAVEPEDLDGLHEGIDEPYVRDRVEDLADDVRRKRLDAP